jgi:hypothetical protein
MAGITYTATQLQAQAGLLVQSVWTSLEEARKFKLWLDDATHSDTLLGPTGAGVPLADLAVIRTAFADLGGSTGLYAVAHGTFTPSGASNYFFTAKQLTGLNYAA